MDRKNATNQMVNFFRQRLKKQVLPYNKVPVGWPVFDEREIFSIIDTILNLRISQGPAVKKFETMMAAYVGKKYAVAVNSGSSANLLALKTLLEAKKIKPGDEIIMPAATFSAVASPALHLGLKPVYVDVEKKSLNIDPLEIVKAVSKKTRVIMAVHSLGNPAEMKKISALAKKHRLIIIEDCCEAHGAKIGKKNVGSFGDLATLSFYVAHNITTGEGGMIFTDNKKYYDILISLREFGRLPLKVIRGKRFSYSDSILKDYDARYVTARLGYNVRMTDLEASLGVVQLKKLDAFNKRRLKIVVRYQKLLNKYPKYIQTPQTRPGTFHSFYAYSFLIKNNKKFNRKDLALFLENKGIETRSFFDGCLPDQPAFRAQPHRSVGRLPVARLLRDTALFVGCHPGLSNKQINY